MPTKKKKDPESIIDELRRDAEQRGIRQPFSNDAADTIRRALAGGPMTFPAEYLEALAQAGRPRTVFGDAMNLSSKDDRASAYDWKRLAEGDPTLFGGSRPISRLQKSVG